MSKRNVVLDDEDWSKDNLGLTAESHDSGPGHTVEFRLVGDMMEKYIDGVKADEASFNARGLASDAWKALHPLEDD